MPKRALQAFSRITFQIKIEKSNFTQNYYLLLFFFFGKMEFLNDNRIVDKDCCNLYIFQLIFFLLFEGIAPIEILMCFLVRCKCKLRPVFC